MNYADYDFKEAHLSSDFGDELARRWFGEEAVNAIPLISRGKRKGLRKGKIQWAKTVKGGWVKTGRYDEDAQRACGFIAPKNKIFYRRIQSDAWDESSLVSEDILDRRLFEGFRLDR